MKLKYYLKGFGVGVLFATVILSVSFMFRSAGKAGMTDEEVILRARELGMEIMTAAASEETSGLPEKAAAEPGETVSAVGETVMVPEETATVPEETVAASEEAVTVPEAATAAPDETSALPKETSSVSEETMPDQEATKSVSTEASISSEIIDDTIIVIQISSGMSSEAVSKMLEKGGVVESAAELNSFLVNEGYSRYIRTGTYEFTKDMSFEDIAAKICR